MSRKNKALKHYATEEIFRLSQRVNELSKAILRWPNSILIGKRVEEMEELEKKLNTLEQEVEK